MASKKKVGGEACGAINCTNSRFKCPGKSFYRFPKEEKRCKMWTQNTRRQDLLARTSDYISRNCYLCSDHFEDNQFMNASTKDRLNWKAIPTKFNVPNPPQKLAAKLRKLPTKRGGPIAKRSRKKSTPPEEPQTDKDVPSSSSTATCHPDDGRPSTCKIWVQNTRRQDLISRSSDQLYNGTVLCEDHFEPSQFRTPKGSTRKRLIKDAVPTIFSVPNPPNTLETKRKPPRKRPFEQSKSDTTPSDDAAQSSKAKKKENKENPFSFKKFLGQSGQKENSQSQRRNAPIDLSRNGSAPTGSPVRNQDKNAFQAPNIQGSSLAQHVTAPPDFASDLPDFIQNHFSDEQSRLAHERKQLPDFTLSSGGQRKGAGRGDQSSAPLFRPDHEESLADTTFSDEEDNEQRGRQLSLPDFLVDSAIPDTQTGGDDSRDSASVRVQGASSRSRLPELPPLSDSVGGERSRNGSDIAESESATVTRLREENRRLQATISQMQQRARDEEIRVAGLEKEISRLRKKEAEETAVMERAVQQVEENLVATTTRAVQAETLVSKLKQDVKTLQGQVKMLSAENEVLQSGDRGLSDIRERTKYASDQLATAAVTAENNLKELLGGVEKLKLLGQVLSSLEKVSDVDSSSTQDTSSKTSPT